MYLLFFLSCYLTEPAVILVLRGVNAFERMQSIIALKSTPHTTHGIPPLDRIMSPTPQLAHLQASIFFREHELFADDDVRKMLPFLPPPISTRQTDSEKT